MNPLKYDSKDIDALRQSHPEAFFQTGFGNMTLKSILDDMDTLRQRAEAFEAAKQLLEMDALLWRIWRGLPPTAQPFIVSDMHGSESNWDQLCESPHVVHAFKTRPGPTKNAGAVMISQKASEIDTGDAVFHAPSKETWLVGFVEGEYLYPCGWPETCAKLSDCTLTRKATPEQRQKLLEEMAGGRNSIRSMYAKLKLKEQDAK